MPSACSSGSLPLEVQNYKSLLNPYEPKGLRAEPICGPSWSPKTLTFAAARAWEKSRASKPHARGVQLTLIYPASFGNTHLRAQHFGRNPNPPTTTVERPGGRPGHDRPNAFLSDLKSISKGVRSVQSSGRTVAASSRSKSSCWGRSSLAFLLFPWSHAKSREHRDVFVVQCVIFP